MWIERILGVCLLLQVYVSRAQIDDIQAPSACPQLRLAYRQQSPESRLKSNAYLPKCTADGLFEPVQCNDLTGSCWCVDQQGYELAGTRQPSLDLVNCTAPRGCASYQCRMLCPYGFELEEDGCPRCQCRNPCDRITCPSGQECTLEDVSCRQPPCTPLPTCKQARSFDNLCPVGKPLSSPDSGRPFLCGIEPNKPQCPVNYLCDVQSGNDYGVCCPLVDKPGLCPATNHPVDADDCSSKCSLDMDCKDTEKCCTVDGCGNICIVPANVTLCLQQKAVVEILLGYNPDYQGYIPQCSEAGEFVPKQCSINGLLCWCVDVNGTHIKGSMGPPSIVHCDQVETVEPQSSFCNETCERNCETGYKYDENGCMTCECIDPCEKISCPEGSVCLLMREEPCLSDKCAFIPTCHRKPSYNCTEGSPLVNSSTGELFNCHNTKCPSTHDCEKTYDNSLDICCPKLADIDVATSETCPEFIEDANFCNNNTCATDIDCQDGMKCCPSKSCGGICVSFKPPRLPTMCEYLRDMGIKHEHEGIGPGLLAIPIPDCREDGTYEPIQCDRHGQCWCVDDFGVEIANTRAVSRSNVDCHQARSQRPCLGLVCRLGCDYGFVLDEKGCPICECRNPCKSAKCPENQICQFFEVKCDSNWCPPLPQCVTYDKAQPTFPECPHGSPMVYEDTNLVVSCDPNSNYQLCPHDHVCTVSRPNEPGVCCPSAAERSNYLNGSDDIIPSDTKTTPVELTKLGTCPEIKSWEVGSCAEECRSDRDCPGPQKCCRNSCGAMTCRDPTGVIGKPGQCPYLVPVSSGSCDYECSSDYDCGSTQKCCSNGCGTQCVEPMKLTACQHHRRAAEHRSRELGIPASHTYLPSCTVTGNFEPVQCHPVSQVCWCVDENGVELPGSRTLAGEAANCSSVDICDPVDCGFECPNGFQLDEKGCPICSCRDPCQGVICKVPGEICRPAKVKCSNSPCPPIPLCLPNLENPCPMGKPLHNDSTGDLIQCGPLGGHCPSSHKCHLSPLGEYAVCCPKPKDVCYQKLDPGHCKASLPRWYFDSKEFICKKFYYGGCGGSLNNFASREHCEQTCSDSMSCDRIRENNLKLLKSSHQKVVFLPKCNKKTGEWEPLQCMESLGLCWCVNEEGNQISGTAVRGIPDCTSRSGRAFGDSSLCPNGEPGFVCPDNMCKDKICLANRNATCRVNPCGTCKIEFYNEMNEVVDCEEGLSACFTEMQEVLNSHAWANHDIPKERIDDILPSTEDTQYLPPPAYPPPPPPPMTMIGRSIEGFIIENPNHIPEEDIYPEQENEDLQMSSSHVTIVVSPRRDGLTIRMSSQMGPKMISNLLQDHMNLFHSFGLPIVKQGFCPSPSLLSVLRSMSQICRDRCFYDSDCPGNKKCCLSKCGMGCVDPYLARRDAEPKMGTCPKESRIHHRLTLACLFAQDECLQDEDCSGNLKCCSTECGNHCVEPVVPLVRPPRMAVTLPICSAEGGYSITQHQEDLSWCVDKYGNPIPDSFTRGDVKCTTDGAIMKRKAIAPVCPDASKTPRVCKNECLKATCPEHPDAICIADPCNECSVSFVDNGGVKVNCQGKCAQPLITGVCKASFIRYFFNQSSQSCEEFTYGGCQGNDNNFESLEQCQSECERAVPVCEQPKEFGMCKALIPRWYYNKDTYKCEEFDYGGCGGNDNNFETKQECEAKCPDLVICPETRITGQILAPCSRLKACATEVCLGNPDAICAVDPCTCTVAFMDDNGKPVSCDVVTTPLPPELVTPPIPHYSRCEHFLQGALLHLPEKKYTPQCTEDGNFVPMQCNPKTDLTQECWCVDEAGFQLPKTPTFPAGRGQCDFVKVKQVNVSLAFIHKGEIPDEKLEPLIESLITQLLDDLSANVHSGIVDVELGPKTVKVLFTLVSANKVHVAFQLEEMVRRGMKITRHPAIDIPADFGRSNFSYIVDPIYAARRQQILDNSITAQHVSYKKSETETETLVIIAIISTVIFLIVLAVLVAIALSRREKDEKPKPSLVNKAFNAIIHGLIGFKLENKELQEKKEVQLAIQTIEAQYESIKQKEKEAESSCPSETSSTTTYADVDETKKDNSINV